MSGADSAHSDYVGSLFRIHYPWLCSRLHRYLNSRAHAEDIAVDAFVQLLSAPQLTPIRQPRALLTTIAQRLVYQVWRRRDLERAYLAALDDDAACAEDRAQVLEALQAIDLLLDRLAGQDQDDVPVVPRQRPDVPPDRRRTGDFPALGQ